MTWLYLALRQGLLIELADLLARLWCIVRLLPPVVRKSNCKPAAPIVVFTSHSRTLTSSSSGLSPLAAQPYLKLREEQCRGFWLSYYMSYQSLARLSHPSGYVWYYNEEIGIRAKETSLNTRAISRQPLQDKVF